MSKIPKLQIKLQEPSKIEESEKSFIETIFYIINNITSKQLKYDTNIENKCDIFKYLKNILPSFLDLKNEEIAKKIIEEHNGSIKAYNEDNGALFEIRLKKIKEDKV